ncbi:hypothetical protein [Candidatus Vallotia cooleyia]|uniref:hypothetical protein n=1 Tax=Candidatus Vallotiella adelgis TaxID=1177211 RepID=UPI001D00BBB9|nr:hypothetical protein [Candidatus Vallotia cooleyia]
MIDQGITCRHGCAILRRIYEQVNITEFLTRFAFPVFVTDPNGAQPLHNINLRVGRLLRGRTVRPCATRCLA